MNRQTTPIVPYRHQHKSSIRLLFSADYSQHIALRIMKTGYRVVIAIDVFTVVMWLWIAISLPPWLGWGVPLLIYIFAPFLGLVWLATVRITFEYLTVIFTISHKLHEVDGKLGYLARRAHDDHAALEYRRTANGHPGR